MIATLTFLFTDLENSTSLWELAPVAMRGALARHDLIISEAVNKHNGRIVKKTGDGLHAVFESAVDGIKASLFAQQVMSTEVWPEETGPLKVRMGLHTGESQEREGDYYGSTVNEAARIMDLGHGGQILLSEVTLLLLRGQKPAGITFTDLGTHKLKGLVAPEMIFQLSHPDLATEFPPLKSSSVPRHNLPTQLTPLVGRQNELAGLSKLLLDPKIVLVSIVAPGGMGKSHLALELASQMLNEFKDGVILVELAPISDSENIIPAVAEAIGYQFQQNGRSPKQQVIDYLNNKQVLLILDNYEQLLDGAGLVAEMLKSASQLKILVTSRQRLYQPGETLFTLPGLDLPDLDKEGDASRYAAVELFQQTAQRAKPDFILTSENLPYIVQICRLVQGMPLGILLAAPWIMVLSTSEIVEEIQHGLDILEVEGSELPERQRSIRVVFDQAWNMMTAADQQVFRKLALCRGGFRREAGQEIARAGLRQLQSLLNQGLIGRDAGLQRYHMHELLRQYAEEKLHQSVDYRRARDAHTVYYLTYLAEQTADLKGSRQLATLKRIETDLENIREGWNEAVSQRTYDLIAQALEAMFLFCFLQSRLEDGKALFDRAAQGLAPEPGDDAPHPVWLALGIRFYKAAESQPVLKARLQASLAQAHDRADLSEAAYCLHTLATIAHYVDQNPQQAIAYYEECAVIYRQIGEKYYLAQTLSNLGEAYQLIGQTELTLKYVNEANQLQRQIGDRMGESETLSALAMTAYQTGDYDAMDDFIEKAYAIQLQTNYLVGQASSNLYRGLTAFLRGEIVEGADLVQQGLDQALDVVDYSTQAWCYAILSFINSTIGNYTSAEEELRKAQGIEIDTFRQTGAGNPFLQLHINLSDLQLDTGKGNFSTAWRHLQQPLNLAVMTSSMTYMTIIMAMGAIIYAHDGNSETAVELLALSHNQSAKVTFWMKHWVLLDQVQPELRAKMGQAAFETTWEHGKSLDLMTASSELLQHIKSFSE